jgi:hypothetical protein
MFSSAPGGGFDSSPENSYPRQAPSITSLSSAMETHLEAAKHGYILNVSHLLVRLLTTSLKDALLLHFAADLTK